MITKNFLKLVSIFLLGSSIFLGLPVYTQNLPSIPSKSGKFGVDVYSCITKIGLDNNPSWDADGECVFQSNWLQNGSIQKTKYQDFETIKRIPAGRTADDVRADFANMPEVVGITSQNLNIYNPQTHQPTNTGTSINYVSDEEFSDIFTPEQKCNFYVSLGSACSKGIGVPRSFNVGLCTVENGRIQPRNNQRGLSDNGLFDYCGKYPIVSGKIADKVQDSNLQVYQFIFLMEMPTTQLSFDRGYAYLADQPLVNVKNVALVYTYFAMIDDGGDSRICVDGNYYDAHGNKIDSYIDVGGARVNITTKCAPGDGKSFALQNWVAPDLRKDSKCQATNFVINYCGFNNYTIRK